MDTTAGLPKHAIKVLWVDDQPIIGEAVRRLLATEADILFRYCSDPTAALHVANEFAPTVILQDLVMPDIDGLMLVGSFGLMPRRATFPSLCSRPKKSRKPRPKSLPRGANNYLVNLSDKIELLARIRYHSKRVRLSGSRTRNDAYRALEDMAKQLQGYTTALSGKTLDAI